jgi:protein SCO1
MVMTSRARSALLGLLAAVWAGFALAAAETAPPALDPDAALKASQAVIGRQLGDFTFLDRNNRQVRLADYRGKPLLVNFVYTGCTSVCPVTTKLLAQAIRKAQGVVGSDSFRVLTIGFNLPYDSPEAMRDFARRFGLDAGSWEFLTPFEGQLADLTGIFGFSYARTAWGFDHITQVTVVDQQGRIYRQVYGDDFSIVQLIDPLKELIEGTPVPVKSLADFIERVRILCTVYDPRANAYRFDITVIGEVVSFVVIAVALLGFVGFEIRKRRRLHGR